MWSFFVFPTLGMGSPARRSLFIKATHTQHAHTIFSPSEDMKNTKRPSGIWGPKQDKLVGDLLCSNTIDYRNRTGEYLFAVSEEHGTRQSSACETSSLVTNKICLSEKLEVRRSLVVCIDLLLTRNSPLFLAQRTHNRRR